MVASMQNYQTQKPRKAQNPILSTNRIGMEHSTWLSLMYPRLEVLRDLLAELDRDEWLDDGALTDAGRSLIQ
jgi:hypothetical protein